MLLKHGNYGNVLMPTRLDVSFVPCKGGIFFDKTLELNLQHKPLNIDCVVSDWLD